MKVLTAALVAVLLVASGCGGSRGRFGRQAG